VKSEVGVVILALLGSCTLLSLVFLCTAWWLWWGYGLTPESWWGFFIPLAVLNVLRSFAASMAKAGKDSA
jgi:hypothetical protein